MEERPMSFRELKEIALKNPNGKIVACEVECRENDACNVGNWKGTDTYRSFYVDLLEASMRLSSDPAYLTGAVETFRPLFELNYESELPEYARPHWTQILFLFWWGANHMVRTPNSIIRTDNSADPDIVLLVGSDEDDVVLIDTR